VVRHGALPPNDGWSSYTGRGLLAGKKALITGGDSGIGRAVAAAFAKEGADVAIAYLTEHDDGERTRALVLPKVATARSFPATWPARSTASRWYTAAFPSSADWMWW